MTMTCNRCEKIIKPEHLCEACSIRWEEIEIKIRAANSKKLENVRKKYYDDKSYKPGGDYNRRLLDRK